MFLIYYIRGATMLNLIYLRYFYDAAALGSVSQAARKNFVTQSALSQGIVKLEQGLGIKVTTHKKQRFILTEEGKVVFEQARTIFHSVKTLQDKLNASQNVLAGELNFVCTNSLGMSFLPERYAEMQRQHPEVELKFRMGGLSFIETWLRQGIPEFGLVLNHKQFHSYDKIVVQEGVFQLYAHKDYEGDLSDGIFVDESETSFVKELQALYRKHYKNELLIKGELSSWEVIARFVDKGIGVGFFPDYIFKNNRFPSLVPLKTKFKPIPYEIVAIHPKGEGLSRAAMALLELF